MYVTTYLEKADWLTKNLSIDEVKRQKIEEE